MAQVAVTVNGRRYDIACDDGQEAHLLRLSQYVDKRIKELVAAVGQIGEARLLLMASLLVADELSDAYGELRTLRPEGGPNPIQLEEKIGATLETLAERVESIAERLERL